MAITCTPENLVEQAKCLNCSQGPMNDMIVYLLCQWANKSLVAIGAPSVVWVDGETTCDATPTSSGPTNSPHMFYYYVGDVPEGPFTLVIVQTTPYSYLIASYAGKYGMVREMGDGTHYLAQLSANSTPHLIQVS